MNIFTQLASLLRKSNDLSQFTEKTSLHDNDVFIIEDSEAGYAKKKVKKTNIGIGGGTVNSVFGRTGSVIATTNDYTWAQIDKSTSDIADITTKSHTDLDDIGTNSHAQIDTHLALLAEGHNVTQTLTDGATVAWDANNGNFATVTYGGDRTMGAVTNQVNGGVYYLIAKAGASARTITWNANFLFPAGSDPTTFLANSTNILTFISDGTNMYGVANYAFA